MKKLLFLSLLFAVAINAMESNSTYPGHQARQATTDSPPISQTNFSQEVIERAEKTTLIEACQDGDLEVVKYFIAAGADVNQTNRVGASLLCLATLKNQIDVVKLLLAHNADMNKSVRDSITPLSLSLNYNYSEITHFLLDNGADVKVANKEPLLFYARDDLALCSLLLARGANPNRKTGIQSGETLLHSAAFTRNTKMCRLLLDGGADPNQPDNQGYTPFHCAVFTRNTKMCLLFLAAGADVNHLINNKETPLDWAMKNDYTEITKLLRAHGASPLKKIRCEDYAAKHSIKKQKELLALFAEETNPDDDAHTNQ